MGSQVALTFMLQAQELIMVPDQVKDRKQISGISMIQLPSFSNSEVSTTPGMQSMVVSMM
jgi:hypothetical protein